MPQGSIYNRTEIVRDYLRDNPTAVFYDFADYWMKTSFPKKELPSRSLFDKAKRKLMAEQNGTNTPEKTPRARKQQKPSKKLVSPINGNVASYEEIERKLDELLDQARELGDKQIVEVLRQSRRILSHRIVSLS